MLPLKNRLKTKRDIGNVFKKGEISRDNFLVLRKIRNNLTRTRFCFFIQKKFFKKVAIRNKLKRVLSEIIKERLEKIKKGFDVLLILLPGIEDIDFKEKERSVEKIFLKAKLSLC